MLARDNASTTLCIAIPVLAARLGMARNTCRRHLDKLMGSGLLMMKLQLDNRSKPLGYLIRLIVDDDCRRGAIDNGFSPQRMKAPEPAHSGRGVS